MCAEYGCRHAFTSKVPSRQVEAEPNCGLDDMAKVNHSSRSDALVHPWTDILLYAFPPIPFLLPSFHSTEQCHHTVFVMARYILLPSSTGAPPVACLAPDGWSWNSENDIAFAKWVSELCALWSNLSTFYVNRPVNLTTFTPVRGEITTSECYFFPSQSSSHKLYIGASASPTHY